MPTHDTREHHQHKVDKPAPFVIQVGYCEHIFQKPVCTVQIQKTLHNKQTPKIENVSVNDFKSLGSSCPFVAI